MKYCYRCGMEYTGDECPGCHTDLYTDRPNTRTTLQNAESSKREFDELVEETKKL